MGQMASPLAGSSVSGARIVAAGIGSVYVLDGEACYETPARAAKLRKGETLTLPGGTPMRAVVTGSRPRHVLAAIVHDAAQPSAMRMEEERDHRL